MDMGSLSEDTEFLEALTLCLPGPCIFPNLERLHWVPDSSEAFQYVRMFLAPSITELLLGNMHSAAHISIFATLAAKCPILTDVTIYIRYTQTTASPAISIFVRSLARVESLSLPGIDQKALAHLAGLSSLTSLSLRSPQIPRLSCDSFGGDDFPALTELTTPTIVCATALVAVLPHCPFVRLIVLPNPNPPWSTAVMAREFYSSVGRMSSRTSLQCLRVDGPSPGPPPRANQIHIYSISAEILHPLFSFTNIVHVDLTHPVGFDLDNAAVLTMARAWPQIRHLSLTAGPFRHQSYPSGVPKWLAPLSGV
jgi:hypothetical protein